MLTYTCKRPCTWAVLKILTVLAASFIVAQDTSPTGPTQDGIVANCNAWHTVVRGDTCYTIEQHFNITADEFMDWNPAISGDCETNLFLSKSHYPSHGTTKRNANMGLVETMHTVSASILQRRFQTRARARARAGARHQPHHHQQKTEAAVPFQHQCRPSTDLHLQQRHRAVIPQELRARASPKRPLTRLGTL